MPARAALKKEIHIANSAAPALVVAVCDSNVVLGFNQEFTWSNPSRQNCDITPSANSVWPFAAPSYHVAAGKTAPGKTLPCPPLAQKQQPYTYQVSGGGCGMAATAGAIPATVPKNVLIP